jgi:hypothetical protein
MLALSSAITARCARTHELEALEARITELWGRRRGAALSHAEHQRVRLVAPELTALDAVTYAMLAVAFTAVAMLAVYPPARRATAIDPLTAVRHE